VWPLFFKREIFFPIFFHIRNHPIVFRGIFYSFFQSTHWRLTIILFPFSIGMIHDHSEAGTGSGACPLQHSIITIRISNSKERSFSNVLMNSNRFTFFIIEVIEVGNFDYFRLTIYDLIFHFSRTAYNLVGWNATSFPRPGTLREAVRNCM